MYDQHIFRSFFIIIIIIYLPLYYNSLKKENKKINNNNNNNNNIQQAVRRGDLKKPQAYRRGHLDIKILNKIRAAKECGRN